LTDADFKVQQDALMSSSSTPQRTARLERWRRESNRDDSNPAFNIPPQELPPDPDPTVAPVEGPLPDTSFSRKGMKEAGQVKRIIIIFGDGSFSPSSPGKLSLIT